MFVLYVNGCALETSYTQIGNVYDLTMVSPGTGMKSCVKSEFDDWFYWPNDGHPDVGGHRYMADCISNMFSVIDQEDTEDLAHDDLSAITPAKGISYVGMKTLESSTDISLLDSVKSITVGGFSGSDTSQPTLQYEKNGEKNMRWFPDAWAHTSSLGNDSFKAIIECNSILVAYKQSSSAFGTAECYLDGKKVATLNKSTGGWNNAQVAVILAGDEVKERTLEIKMASGDENKPFTIYAIGYANINE